MSGIEWSILWSLSFSVFSLFVFFVIALRGEVKLWKVILFIVCTFLSCVNMEMNNRPWRIVKGNARYELVKQKDGSSQWEYKQIKKENE